MRTMQTADERPEANNIGLILHRIAHEECSPVIKQSKYVVEQCDANSKSLNFSEFFSFFSAPNLRISSAYLTLRPKQAEKATVNSGDAVLKHVQPMQIEAFKVTL